MTAANLAYGYCKLLLEVSRLGGSLLARHVLTKAHSSDTRTRMLLKRRFRYYIGMTLHDWFNELLGHSNASNALLTFVKQRYSLEVAALLHRAEILSTTTQIREQLCLIYGNLLTLTSLISIRFYKAAQGWSLGFIALCAQLTALGASTSLSLDIYEICGDVMESFRERKIMATDLIWEQQAVVAGVDLEKSRFQMSIAADLSAYGLS